MARVDGLRTVVDGTSIVQLTNQFTYYRLASSVSETITTSWPQLRNTYRSKSFTVTIPSGAKVAVAVRAEGGKCWARKTAQSSTSVTFELIGELGNVIYGYVFVTAPPPNNPSNRGLELRSGGANVFCSDYPIMKVLGQYSTESGYTGMSTVGRVCAVVPMKEYINEGSVDDLPFSPNCELTIGGGMGWTGQIQIWEERSVVDTNKFPPEHSLRNYNQSIYIPCQSNPVVSDETHISMSASYLVIDVAYIT